jgi:hypothetical protein
MHVRLLERGADASRWKEASRVRPGGASRGGWRDVEGAKEERAPRFSLNKTIAILFLPFYQIWRADTWTPVTLCPHMDQDPLNCFKLPQREVEMAMGTRNPSTRRVLPDK